MTNTDYQMAYDTPPHQALETLAPDRSGFRQADAALVCGWCGGPGSGGVQLMAPVVHLAGDLGDPDSPLRNRGSWVEIPVECETCGRVTVIVFGFHKGSVFMAARTRREVHHLISRCETDPER